MDHYFINCICNINNCFRNIIYGINGMGAMWLLFLLQIENRHAQKTYLQMHCKSLYFNEIKFFPTSYVDCTKPIRGYLSTSSVVEEPPKPLPTVWKLFHQNVIPLIVIVSAIAIAIVHMTLLSALQLVVIPILYTKNAKKSIM